MDNLRFIEAESFVVDIFIAGDVTSAKRICQLYCLEVGLCVTVSATDYIYTGGAETGVRIGLVNYPRFPTINETIWATARDLALLLIDGLYQHSALIVAHGARSLWVTRRPE